MFVLLRKWKSREPNMSSSDNTVPPLEAFWAIHDQSYYDIDKHCEVLYEPADARYVCMGISSHLTDRRFSYLLVKDITDDVVWGIQIYSPDSWTEEYKDLYVRGPFKMSSSPRVVTVIDYTEVVDDLAI